MRHQNEEEEEANEVHCWKNVYANKVNDKRTSERESNVNVLMIGRLLF